MQAKAYALLAVIAIALNDTELYVTVGAFSGAFLGLLFYKAITSLDKP